MPEITLTSGNFNEVLNKSEVLLVDLWAEWCGPCKMIAPTIAEIAKEFEGRASVGKVDIDENPSIATQYDVTSIPTLLFFKKGELKAKLVGAQPKHIISKKMTEVLSSP